MKVSGSPAVQPPVTPATPGKQAPAPGKLAAPAPADSFAAKVQEIALSGPITDPKAQISAMAWHGDALLLLPEDCKRVYALDKAEIVAAVDGQRGPLTPREMKIDPAGFADRLPGFDGFEAIAVAGDRVFLLGEAKSETESWGYLMSGTLGPHGITLDVESLKPLPASGPKNLGYEALVVSGDRVIALPEANVGRHVAYAFSVDDLLPLGEVAMPPVDYRLTDSTPADADGRFWVANYNHPEDKNLPAAPRVEQLVPMHVARHGIEQDGPAVPIELDSTQPGRNWEAVARLDDRGLLVMTDMYPRAIFGFVPVK